MQSAESVADLLRPSTPLNRWRNGWLVESGVERGGSCGHPTDGLCCARSVLNGSSYPPQTRFRVAMF